MNQFLTDSDATRIVQAVEGRVVRKLKNGAKTYTTWGQVADVGVAVCSVYIHEALTGVTQEDGTEPEASGGFRVPAFVHVEPGSFVKVAIDYETGERWVLEQAMPSGDYPRLVIDASSGYIYTGDGTAYPAAQFTVDIPDPLTLADLHITNDITLDDDLTLASGSVLTWASDVNLYRDSANVLKTDDQFSAPTLRLTDTTDVDLSSTGHAFQIGSSAGANIAMDGNEIMARNNGAAADLNLNADGGKTTISVNATSTTAADGLQFGGDVNLYRSAANILTSDDRIQSAASPAFHATAGYMLAERASGTGTSFLIGQVTSDTGPRIRIGTNVSGYGSILFDDGTASAGSEDTNLYRNAADSLTTDDDFHVGGNLYANIEEGSFDTFSISGGGSATFGSKLCRWFQIGKIVVFRIGFSVTGNGSGSSDVTVGSFTGMPGAASTCRIWGDRGGTGVTPIVGRFSGGTPSISAIDQLSGTRVIGSGLVSGASYTFVGCYVAS